MIKSSIIIDRFDKLANEISRICGTWWSAALAFLLIATWTIVGFFEGFSEFFQMVINTVTTIITFLMVFIIQHSQVHDTRALHLKIDEIIRSQEAARNEYRRLEQQPETEIDRIAEEDVGHGKF